MEILRKFASRKFIAAAASFAMSVLAVIYGGENEVVKNIGAIGVILAPALYMLLEAWLDGKAVVPSQYVPTVSTAIYDLVQIYEDKYGEDGVTNFIQDLAVLVKNHFDEEDVTVETQEIE